MFPQRRMTTDTPDGNYSQALNLFVRGEDGWVQMPSRSISLNDYMKQLIKAHNADIDTEGTPEEFDMTLCEHLFDGPETIEGLLAEHYTLSWALASLRDKLKHYEDALIPCSTPTAPTQYTTRPARPPERRASRKSWRHWTSCSRRTSRSRAL